MDTYNDDFKVFSLSFSLKHKIRDYQLIEIEEREYRRSYPIYYSRVYRYKLLGYLFEKNPFTKSDYLLSTCCFSTMDTRFNCTKCEKKSDSVFLNCRIFLSYSTYKKLAKKHMLDETEEFMRDQRTMLSNPEKQEIISMALHPDRIFKILKISKDSWTNLENYI